MDRAWVVRLVLANETDADLALTRVRLGWRAEPGTVVTAVAAGAEAAYAVQDAGGAGSLLVGRLRSGAQAGVDAEGFVLVPPVLGPGHRWAVQWRFEVVADVPAARRAQRADDLPLATWLGIDQPVLLPAGPDVAVVADGLAVEVREDHVEVDSARPGAYTVELRSARGTAAYELGWAPDLDELVDAAAQAALGGPTTPAGTVRLDGAVAGLLVQDALGRRTVDAPDAAADALELLAGGFVERLDERLDEDLDRVDAPVVAFLAREADRTGDPTLLEAAVTGLMTLTRCEPGVGRAAVVLGRVRAGRTPTAALAHLAALHTAAPPEEVGALELALLLRPRRADAAAGPVLDDVTSGLRRLGASLGAGLPGRVVPPLAVDRVAHAAVVLGLVDEASGRHLRTTWGVTAVELARWSAAEARARVAEAPQDEASGSARRALGWLVLGGRVGP